MKKVYHLEKSELGEKLSFSAGLSAEWELILINAGCLYKNGKSVFKIRGHASHILRLRFFTQTIYTLDFPFLLFC